METTSAENRCWSCKAGIDAEDRYCRHCGQGQGQSVAWYYQWWGILLTTFLGLGPFALPLVWRSPALSRPVRLILGAIVLVFSFFVCVGTYHVIHQFQAMMNGALQIAL